MQHFTKNYKTCFRSFKRFCGKTHQHVLRWMARKDAARVDFGIWKSIPMSALSCPLDVHSGNVARKLGLLNRKQKRC